MHRDVLASLENKKTRKNIFLLGQIVDGQIGARLGTQPDVQILPDCTRQIAARLRWTESSFSRKQFTQANRNAVGWIKALPEEAGPFLFVVVLRRLVCTWLVELALLTCASLMVVLSAPWTAAF